MWAFPTHQRTNALTHPFMPFLTASDLNKSYQVGTQRLHVLRDLDLAVERGEMVAVVGASGVGKSTLLHLLGGLDRMDSGSIRIGERSEERRVGKECRT